MSLENRAARRVKTAARIGLTALAITGLSACAPVASRESEGYKPVATSGSKPSVQTIELITSTGKKGKVLKLSQKLVGVASSERWFDVQATEEIVGRVDSVCKVIDIYLMTSGGSGWEDTGAILRVENADCITDVK